jgi:nitrate reductase beta subunit
VGRIRYLGVILYDAARIHEVASCSEKELIDQQLSMLLDPWDPEVIKNAKANGIADSTIHAAQNSPTYKFVIKWGLALPLHIEYRTMPMLFYVPPLLPVMASVKEAQNQNQNAKLNPLAKVWDDSWLYDTSTAEIFGTISEARLPLKYLANLLGAGDEDMVKARLKKLMAVRIYRRFKTVGDIAEAKANEALAAVGYTQEMAEEVYKLTSLAKFDDRFVIPAAHREQSIEMLEFTGDRRGTAGRARPRVRPPDRPTCSGRDPPCLSPGAPGRPRGESDPDPFPPPRWCPRRR